MSAEDAAPSFPPAPYASPRGPEASLGRESAARFQLPIAREDPGRERDALGLRRPRECTPPGIHPKTESADRTGDRRIRQGRRITAPPYLGLVSPGELYFNSNNFRTREVAPSTVNLTK